MIPLKEHYKEKKLGEENGCEKYHENEDGENSKLGLMYKICVLPRKNVLVAVMKKQKNLIMWTSRNRDQ